MSNLVIIKWSFLGSCTVLSLLIWIISRVIEGTAIKCSKCTVSKLIVPTYLWVDLGLDRLRDAGLIRSRDVPASGD